MKSSQLFTPDNFANKIQSYLHEQQIDSIQLSENELLQLRYFMGTEFLSPEAAQQDSFDLHFEIKRSLTRLQCLHLLQNGDPTSYEKFVHTQSAKQLSYEQFQACAQQLEIILQNSGLEHLSCYRVLRATCFIAASDPSKGALNEYAEHYPKDGEQIITALVEAIQTEPNPEKRKKLLPAAADLTKPELNALAHCYWRLTHARWMMFAEGNRNLASYINEKFNQPLWEGRWLLNLCGMSAGPGAKYLVQPIFNAFNQACGTLRQARQTNQLESVVENYLLKLADVTEFQAIKPKRAKCVLGYLTAICLHLEPNLPDNYLQQIQTAYNWMKENYSSVLQIFEHQYNEYLSHPTAGTPTFVPGLLKNAYAALQTLELGDNQPFATAVIFTLQVRTQIAFEMNKTAYQEAPSAGTLANSKTLADDLQDWLNCKMNPSVLKRINNNYGNQIVVDKEFCELESRLSSIAIPHS